MKKFLVHILMILREMKRDLNVDYNKSFEKSRLEADIIRNVHSIEKGLCLENPRKGFGVAKIKSMFNLADRFLKLNPDDITCLYFVIDGVSEYLEFNKKIGFDNEDIKQIKEMHDKLIQKIVGKDARYGGVDEIAKSEMDFDIESLENFFNTRHSVREFSGESVSEETLKKAIALAQKCPSACNRQGVRVYSIKGEKFLEEMKSSLDGIGGFAKDVDRFLLITGKQSAYKLAEKNQYAVSASIFAAYLTLTLHTYGVAACVVQRPLVPNKYWVAFRDKNGIPADEQLVIMIGIGGYKDKTKVPVSKRFAIDRIYCNLDNKS